MTTAFAVPANNLTCTVGPGGYTSGSSTLTLSAGQGANFPALTGSQFYRITVIQAAFAYSPAVSLSNLTIYRASSLATDTFGSVLAIEGTTDRDYVSGDAVDVRVTAGTISDIQNAINSLDPLSQLASSTIAISTTYNMTSANFGRNHVCSGTTGNYTVTLPAVSGNDGKFINIMMSPSLTKLVTIARNASDLIDGATSRVMWANETACLFCNGTNWVKVYGKSIPMSCLMYRTTAALNIPGNGVMTAIPVDAVSSDPTGLMTDLGNGQILIARTGTYNVLGNVYLAMNGAGSATYILVQVGKNGVQTFLANTNAAGAGSAQPIPVLGVASLTAGNALTLASQQGSGQNAVVQTGSSSTFLSVQEFVTW